MGDRGEERGTRPLSSKELYAVLPREISTSERFVCWSREYNRKTGRWEKPAFCAVPGPFRNWKKNEWQREKHATLEQAVSLRDSAGHDGIGWYPRADVDGKVAIDLDRCRKNGELNPFAAEFIKRLPDGAYAEISPSDLGLRAIVDCPTFLAIVKAEKYGIEIYPLGSYLTLTGNCLTGAGTPVLPDGEEILSWLLERAGRSWPKESAAPKRRHGAPSSVAAPKTLHQHPLVPPNVVLPRKADGTVDRSRALFRLARSHPRTDRREIIDYLKRCDRELWRKPKYSRRPDQYGIIADKVLASVPPAQSEDLEEKNEEERARICEGLLAFAMREPSWQGVEGITEFYAYLAMVLYAWTSGRLEGGVLEVALDRRGHAVMAGIGSHDTLHGAVRRLSGLQKRRADRKTEEGEGQEEDEAEVSRVEHGLIECLTLDIKREVSRYRLRVDPSTCTGEGHIVTGGWGGSGPLVCATLLRIRRLCGHRAVVPEDSLQLTKLGGLVLARLSTGRWTSRELAASLGRTHWTVRRRYLDCFVKHGLVQVEGDRYSVVKDLESMILEYLETSGMLGAEDRQLLRYETERELRSLYLNGVDVDGPIPWEALRYRGGDRDTEASPGPESASAEPSP